MTIVEVHAMRRVLALVALVTAGFGVVLALSAPAGAGGGGGCHEMTDGAGDAVELVGSCFTPSVLRVATGTEVTWTNQDPVDHVVVGTGWSLDRTLGADESGSHRFDEAGTYPYTCHLHPGMNGVVLVGDRTAAGASPSATDDGRDVAELAGARTASSGDDGGTSPIGAGAIGAIAGLTVGAVGARIWPGRLGAR